MKAAMKFGVGWAVGTPAYDSSLADASSLFAYC